MTDPQRKKLKKLLGKVCIFSGTKTRESGSNFIVTDIFHKNKLIVDHVWVPLNKVNRHIPIGSRFTFKATPFSYIDLSKQRKYGLSKVHDITLKPIQTKQDDNKEKNKRLGYSKSKTKF